MAEAKKSAISDDRADLDAQLRELRQAIDAIDREILERLNRRAERVCEVGRVKQSGRRSPVYVASRERDLVTALLELNRGPFPDAAIPHVFREIISATRSLEKMGAFRIWVPRAHSVTWPHCANSAPRSICSHRQISPMCS